MNTYALNLKNLALTQYDDNFNFNSICTDGINYYGASDAGIHLLRGDTDDGAPIAAHIRTGTHDFDSSFLKHFHAVYLGVKSEAALELKIIPDDNQAYAYNMDNDGYPQAHTVKIATGKGMKTRYITFELSNTDGGYFEIGSIEMLFEMTSRRAFAI
ncbi:MAG: hypothetical protein HQL01_12880 [Nitrospirae bacterium]|nr:hypothetical protein [Nitrospirota bacterium]